MKILFVIFYIITLILILYFIYNRLNDVNAKNIENIGCTYLKKRNNRIFIFISFLIILLAMLGSLVILTLL